MLEPKRGGGLYTKNIKWVGEKGWQVECLPVDDTNGLDSSSKHQDRNDISWVENFLKK